MLSRVLLAVINYDHPQSGMLRDFRARFGEANVREFDYMQRQRNGSPRARINADLVEASRAFRPDWVWLQLQDIGIITADTIARIRRALPSTVVTHWTGDCRRSVSPYLSSICRAAHATFASSVGQLPMFRAAGAPIARYVQIGLDWDEDVEGLPAWTPPFRVPDVVLCGNHYGPGFPGTTDREAAVRALMAARINVGVVGSRWPTWAPRIGSCGVKQQHHVYRRAKVALSVNHFNDIELYYSDRQLIAMASGTPVVCRHVPGLEREFTDGVHCRFYREPGDMVRAAEELLGDPDRRTSIGAAGREEVKLNHTWASRIASVLPVVEDIRSGLQRR